MNQPEETRKSENPTPSEATFPKGSTLPEGFTPIGDSAHVQRARRRRAQRMLVPPAADERAAMLDNLAQRAFPSLEFFLFAFLCGAILGAAYLLNAPALLLVGILLAPLLTPWVGMTLAVVTGSWRFFFLTLIGLLAAALLVFLTGALAGLAGRFWNDLPFFYARLFAIMWWPYYLPDLFVVILGSALLAFSFIRSEQKPILASVMLAYGLFLPVSAAGIGLGIGKEISGDALWPNGLLVALIHLVLATLVGGIVLVGMRFKPLKASGYFLPGILGLTSVVVLVVSTGLVTSLRDGITATRHLATTPTSLILPSSTPTVFPTSTTTPTSLPTATLSPTSTLEPTPAFAMVMTGPDYGGANLRTTPGGTLIKVLGNGLIVEVLPDSMNIGSVTWAHVRTPDGVVGWVLQSVLNPSTLPSVPTISTTP